MHHNIRQNSGRQCSIKETAKQIKTVASWRHIYDISRVSSRMQLLPTITVTVTLKQDRYILYFNNVI